MILCLEISIPNPIDKLEINDNIARVYFEDTKFEVPLSDLSEEKLARMITIKLVAKTKVMKNNNLNKSTV